MRTLLLLLSFTSAAAWCQDPVAGIAHGGAHGNFVFTGDIIPQAQGTITGYRIERRQLATDEFKQVAELGPVASAKELAKELERTAKVVPYPAQALSMPIDSMWKMVQRGERRNLGPLFNDLPTLMACRLAWHDADAKTGERYQYRITPIGGAARVSTWATAGQGETPVPITPGNGLYWEKQNRMELHYRMVGMPRSGAYRLWRSDDGEPFEEVPWIGLADMQGDTVQLTFIDTTAARYRPLRYALKAWDPYGHAAPPVDTLYTASLDPTQMPMPVAMEATGDSSGRAIRISWGLPNAPLVKKLTLYRSTNSVDGFSPIAVLSSDRMSYLDEEAMPATPYFYYFVLEYRATHMPMRSHSFASVVYDASPPMAPNGLEAVVTEDGVSLTWQHDQPGTYGFEVFRAFDGDAFRPLTAMLPPTRDGRYAYLDASELARGNKTVHYTVRATSTSHVQGLFSDTVRVLPLLDKPVAASPLEVNAKRDGDLVTLTWEDLRASDPFVSGYRVARMRRAKTSDGWVTDTLWRDVNFLVDTLGAAGGERSYRVITFNAFGTQSIPSASVTVVRNADAPSPPNGVSAQRSAAGVKVNWHEALSGTATRYEVFRYTRGSEVVKVGQVAAKNALTLVDTQALAGKLHFYYVVAVGSTGVASERSMEVGVE